MPISTAPRASWLTCRLTPTFRKGGTLDLDSAFDPGRTLSLIARHRVTYLFGVPAMFRAIAATGLARRSAPAPRASTPTSVSSGPTGLRSPRRTRRDPQEPPPPRHCHGGPKASLDLDGLRAENVAAEAARYDRWLESTAGTPEARPRREFYRQATESRGYSKAKAEKDYFAQPRLQALKGTEFDFRRLGCPVESLQKPRGLLLEQARLTAVPGWATLTTDGRWLEKSNPGYVGFPPQDEDADHRYLKDANAHTDSSAIRRG